jgi:hypothetical protein
MYAMTAGAKDASAAAYRRAGVPRGKPDYALSVRNLPLADTIGPCSHEDTRDTRVPVIRSGAPSARPVAIDGVAL